MGRYAYVGALVLSIACAGLAAAQSVEIGRYVELPYGVGRGHPYGMTGADGRRSSRSLARAPRAAPRERWATRLSERRLLPPAILADGTLAIGSASGVSAFDTNGKPLWKVRLGQVRFTPSVTPAGELLVATYEGKLWLVERGGRQRRLESRVALSGLPLVLDGGSVVIGARDSQVHVLDLEGTELLRVPTGAREPFWTASVGGGLLAVAGPERELVLLSLHAGRERVVKLPERVTQGLAVDDRSTVWLIGDQGTLFGVGADGRFRATIPLGDRGSTPVAIGRDGALRLGLPTREVVCIGADGRERWRRGIDGRPSAPLLDADDTLLVLSARGSLYAIDARGELLWRVRVGVHQGSRPVLGADGTIYLVGRDGLVKAVR
ncbi:MAG: PQQ-binding-like beta-propeller repeat protein [Myxococcales bacterium]|nr:PQQ-binding-like beta-propeller repeat protein [Myxococcales bacterium]